MLSQLEVGFSSYNSQHGSHRVKGNGKSESRQKMASFFMFHFVWGHLSRLKEVPCKAYFIRCTRTSIFHFLLPPCYMTVDSPSTPFQSCGVWKFTAGNSQKQLSSTRTATTISTKYDFYHKLISLSTNNPKNIHHYFIGGDKKLISVGCLFLNIFSVL